jgi:hypothetical protein
MKQTIKTDKKIKKGKCVACGKITKEINPFTDDGEIAYPQFCHDECHEHLWSKI